MGEIKRLEDSDPRMAQLVIHNGIVYMSGQVDKTTSDGMYKAVVIVCQVVD